MPALFRRSRPEDDDVEVHSSSSPPSVAALIADHLEAASEEERTLSHREFREYVRDRGRSQDEALSAIRAAARTNGKR